MTEPHKHHRPWVGYLLAAIGVLILLADITMHFLSFFTALEYEMNSAVQVIATVIGFVGFYLISPKGAREGTGILIGALAVIRSGRRATDTHVVVPAPVPDEVPPTGNGEGWEG